MEATKAAQVKPKSGTDAKSNFGAKGWHVIIFCAFMLFFSTGTSVDGLNATVPALAALHGWDEATLLSFSTVSGLISIAGMFVFGLVCHKKGARFTAVLSLALGGAAYIWYGNVQSVMQYALALILVSLFANVYAWIAGGAYLSSWFPKKKGLALGWATMGNNISSALIVVILTFLANRMGMPMAITVIGIAMLALAVWGIFVKNNPEDMGATPDNEPMSVEAMEAYRKQADDYVSPWTFARLVKTKEFWFISLGLGLYMLVTVGVMSQLVPRMVALGLEQNTAIASMTVCAVIGIVGSYLWGVLDQKLTTRVATAVYGVWYAVAILFNLLPGRPCLYISIFMIGMAIGGNANWPASLVTTVYGHRNFAKVYSLINPCISIIRVCAFSVLALALTLTGSLSGAYVVFVVLLFIAAFLILKVDDKKYADGNTCV